MRRNRFSLHAQTYFVSAAIALLSALPFSAAQATPPTYRVVDLGEFLPSALNNKGQVAGSVTDPNTYYSVAASWSKGKLTLIGPAPSYDGFDFSWTYAINRSGQITVAQLENDYDYRAHIWNPATGRKRDVGYAHAYDINDAGDVVISTDANALFPEHAYVLPRNGTPQALPCKGDSWVRPCIPVGINNNGAVVGYSYVDTPFGERYRPFKVTESVLKYLRRPRGVAADWEARNLDINNAGQVLGQIYQYGGAQGQRISYAIWNGAIARTLAGPGSAARINDRGHIVGSMPGENAESGDSAALWIDGDWMDVHSLIDPADPLASRVHLSYGVDINERDWIVAVGTRGKNPNPHGFLLTTVGD